MKFNDAQKILLDFFSSSRVRSTKVVWEQLKDSENWKWVLTIHNLNWGDALIIYTKFILKTDSNKDELLSTQFSYLYDLNCKYHFVNFENEEDLKSKLQEIIFKNKFGEDIKCLSKFIENPTMRLNNELASQHISDYTIYDIDYSPKYTVVPCKMSSFDFKFDINNTYEIELNIKKESEHKYDFYFKFNDEDTQIEVSDLLNIEKTIIKYITSKINV